MTRTGCGCLNTLVPLRASASTAAGLMMARPASPLTTASMPSVVPEGGFKCPLTGLPFLPVAEEKEGDADRSESEELGDRDRGPIVDDDFLHPFFQCERDRGGLLRSKIPFSPYLGDPDDPGVAGPDEAADVQRLRVAPLPARLDFFQDLLRDQDLPILSEEIQTPD